MRTRLICVCVVVSLGFAACGSDKPTTASPEADTATAKKLVVAASDFPPGWTAKPRDQESSADAKASSKELSDCTGTTGEESVSARWAGDKFSMEKVQISSNANLVKDKAAFRKDVDGLKGPKLQPCIKDAFTKLLTKELGTAPTSVEAARLTVPKHGDVAVGVRLTVTAGPAAKSVYFDLVRMGKSRAEVSATLISAGQPIDPALEKSLLDKLGRRVDAA